MRRKYGKRYTPLKNQLPHIIICSIFCIGIIIGSLFSNKSYTPIDNQMHEIESLVENFIANININSLPKSYLMTKAFSNYSKQVLLVWTCGLFYLTTPLIGLLVGVLGFSYGFTTSFFVMQYGFKGLLICFAAYGIQGTLFASLIFLLAVESFGFAQKEKTVSFKIYIIYLIVALFGVIMLAIYEAYVAPVFIQHTIMTFF